MTAIERADRREYPSDHLCIDEITSKCSSKLLSNWERSRFKLRFKERENHLAAQDEYYYVHKGEKSWAVGMLIISCVIYYHFFVSFLVSGGDLISNWTRTNDAIGAVR